MTIAGRISNGGTAVPRLDRRAATCVCRSCGLEEERHKVDAPRSLLRPKANPLLPITFTSAFLFFAGGWWTFGVFAWLAWEKRFRSPALARRLADEGGPKLSMDLSDAIIFGLPMVVPLALGLDGLFLGGIVLDAPTWTFPFLSTTPAQVAGLVLLLVGLPLFTAGAYLTGKYVYSKLPEERPLMVLGPYSFIRHPIYLSFLLIGIGFVLTAENYLALLCLSLVVNTKGWTHEEATLEQRYGDAYREYKRKTGAFFPRFRRGT